MKSMVQALVCCAHHMGVHRHGHDPPALPLPLPIPLLLLLVTIFFGFSPAFSSEEKKEASDSARRHRLAVHATCLQGVP